MRFLAAVAAAYAGYVAARWLDEFATELRVSRETARIDAEWARLSATSRRPR